MTSEELQRAFKYLFPNEVPALKHLAQQLPPNPVVVNIGAGAGTSGLALLEARPDLILLTIDVQYEDSPFGCIKAEWGLVKEAGYMARYGWVEGGSIQIGRNYQLQPSPDFAMVFIDGEHSYEGCRGDIEAWLPNIKPGGIIAVHDYKKESLYTDDYHADLPHPNYPHPRAWPGVDQAVDELLLNRYELVMRVDSLIAFKV